jgi:putative ATP-dependent endonuclease of OLD family
MFIHRVKVENYRCLVQADVVLNPRLNVIVGNNECGKSTLLEAINVALTGLLNGRPLQAELHPYLFNASVVSTYIANLQSGIGGRPPRFQIELYFVDDARLAGLKGTINSRKENLPGVTMTVEFNDEYAAEFADYVSEPSILKTLPVEYYVVRWRSFADAEITSRSIQIKPTFIDASTIRNNAAASKYVVDIMRDSLDRKQKVDLALSYRMMKDAFLQNDRVRKINAALASKRGEISDKELSVSLDTTSRASWETGVMPHLDDVPLPLVGKGEQNSVKIKLALEASADSHIVLIEEAENHLSHSNLNGLIEHIDKGRGDRQLLITTHSSFVLNKLGIESVLMFQRGKSLTLEALGPSTQDYFMKLPGHDTLRLILSSRSILVEGPSDELIVQRAYYRKHGKLPIENGVDVISVRSLAFKRFLEIAARLQTPVAVITDNDGDVAALKTKYEDFQQAANIQICFDTDESARTLEPQLLKANGRDLVGRVLGKAFSDDAEALKYMKANKADTALRFFEASEEWVCPEYIARAL